MAKKVKELVFTTSNRVGILSRVSAALKGAGVNILHASACGEGSKGYFRIVTNDNGRAVRALKKIGIRAKQTPVLLLSLSNRAGALAEKAKKLARANINIKGISATSAGSRVSLLLRTSNDSKAARLV